MKPNNKLLYVHKHSNHPPSLLKNIPYNINKRLSNIASNENAFNENIKPYQEALQQSGYDHKLTYHHPTNNNRRKNRKRKTTWYNPPWNGNVKTNLGRKFITTIKKCFPKNHPLHKIFNTHTLKLSYSCMPNIKSIISSHNKKVLSTDPEPEQTDKNCNCRKKTDCPLQENCLQTNVIYQATVTTDTTTETYVGLATNFKERFRNHKTSLKLIKRRNETEVSKYIWKLKDENKKYNIK